MSLRDLLDLVLGLYFYAVLAWVILSWIPVTPEHPLGRIGRYLDRIVFPMILPIRRVLPPIRLGGGALDLSPIVLLVAISLLRGLV